MQFYSKKSAFVQIQIKDQSSMYSSKYDHLSSRGKKLKNKL